MPDLLEVPPRLAVPLLSPEDSSLPGDALAGKRAWEEVTSLDRKLAIPPPAEGLSLNLLAERWSRVRAGLLENKTFTYSTRNTSSVLLYLVFPSNLTCLSSKAIDSECDR